MKILPGDIPDNSSDEDDFLEGVADEQPGPGEAQGQGRQDRQDRQDPQDPQDLLLQARQKEEEDLKKDLPVILLFTLTYLAMYSSFLINGHVSVTRMSRSLLVS